MRKKPAPKKKPVVKKTARTAAAKKPAGKNAPAKKTPATRRSKPALKKIAAPKKKVATKKAVAKKPVIAKKKAGVKKPARPAKKTPVAAKKAAPVKAPAPVKLTLVKSAPGAGLKTPASAKSAAAERPQGLRPIAVPPAKPVRAPRPPPPPPPSHPVPAKEMARYRGQLEVRKAAILESFNDYRARSQGLGEDGTQDIGDQATNSYNKEFFLSLSEEQRGQIKAIDEALRRIERGVYGICAACGDEIEPRRLNAVPWSSLCLRCQDALDQVRPEEMI